MPLPAAGGDVVFALQPADELLLAAEEGVAVDIAGDALKADPARLADEFGAMSLMGGRRVIRVRPAGEESAAALENLVAAGAGDALIILEGGNLTPRSSLRTLAETEPTLAALACYADTGEDLERLVEGAARAEGFSVEEDALSWITERLGGDRVEWQD